MGRDQPNWYPPRIGTQRERTGLGPRPVRTRETPAIGERVIVVNKPKIRPQKWQPPRDTGLVGDFVKNSSLRNLTTIPVPGTGPEDVSVSSDGWVYTGVREGAILRIRIEGGPVEFVVETGGRPLGIEAVEDGSLIVCDADAGLLRVDPQYKTVEILVSELAGSRPLFVNNAAVAADGTVYFTDTSTTASVHHFKADLLEHGCTGRLFRRGTGGEVDLVLDGLSFANGVALTDDGNSLMLAETGAYQVSKVHLTGERAGQRDVVIENLPGLPDNISTGNNGIFWVALPSLRNRLLDTLLPRPAWLRQAVWALPAAVQPEASRVTFVLGIDVDGQVVHNLQSDGKRFHYVTGVREAAGQLWLGSLAEAAIAKIEWPLPA